MSKHLHADDNNDAKAKAIPRVFSENSLAKNASNQQSLLLLVFSKKSVSSRQFNPLQTLFQTQSVCRQQFHT